jgi:hypothetical protein
MSNPWLKFYPSDWRSDPALRMCSIGARGLWMEMLCVMHENGGDLAINAKGLTPRQLANLAGCGVDEVDALLSELEDAGVFSRRDDGTIYSRRMIRDAAKAEADKANGRKGGNPKIMAGVNPPDNGQDKAQKPEARSQIPEDTPPNPQGGVEADLFDEFVSAYPASIHSKPDRAKRQFSRLTPELQRLAISQARVFRAKTEADRQSRQRSAEAHAEFVPGMDGWLRDGAWKAVTEPTPIVPMTKLDRERDAALWAACELVMGRPAPTSGMTWSFLNTVIEQAREVA